MKAVLSRAYRVLAATLAIVLLEFTPLPFLLQTAHAATGTLTVNGAQQNQVMDGFGTNINSASWKNGELKPALDKLADSGVTLWRVVVESTDWEATNDDADPNNFNWAYYNTVYSSQKFQDLWNTIAYLNSKGFSNNIIVNFMGPGPAWMGRDVLTTTDSNKNEWVEMAASVAYYARNTAHVQFGLFAPGNEPDLDCASAHEGICMDSATYADVMTRLAAKLDAIGLSDLRFIGPDTGFINRGVAEYIPAMTAKSALMAKLAHYGFHDYNGNTSFADATIKSSAYPTKNFWMDEVSQFNDAFSYPGQGAAGVLTWDGFDSIYNHPQLRGEPAIAPNDPGDAPALLAYNSTTGVYTPRKEYYQFEQLFKYVPGGSVRVTANNSASGVTTYAFVDPASGRVTIVGNNTSASSVTFAGSLSGISTAVPAFEYYTTDSGSANFQRGADVPVNSGSFSVTAPANAIFTLTYAGTPDTTAPTVNMTAPANGATVYGSATLQATASDNTGVSKVNFLLDGTALLASVTTTPYQYTWNLNGVSAGTHTLSAVAYDSSNNTATSTISVTVLPDTTAPSVPTSVTGSSSAGNRVDLSWSASTDDSGAAVTYIVKRNGSVIGNASTTSYADTTVSPAATYNYTVAAMDGAGNISADSTAVQVTTSAAAPLTAGTPVITHQTSANKTITSGTFTAHAGDLVVAFLDSDGPSGSAQSFGTPTTTGLTWTLRKRANATSTGTAEIWSAVVPATGFTSGTLSATRATGSYQGSVTIVAFSNADTTTAMATGSASGTNSAPSVSLTTTRAGSQVWATGDDWTNVGSRTAASGQTIVDQYLPTNIGAYWVQKLTNPIVTPGTVTVADTAPTTGDTWNFAAIEILPIVTTPADTQAPTVSLTAPTAGATLSGTQTLSATANDNTGVTKVEFYDNGTLLATDTATPYTYSWNTTTATNGSHTLTVKAYDAAGNVGVSTSVVITVFNDTIAPSVPANVQAVVAGESEVDLSWNASTDNVATTGYNVFRANATGSFSKVATVSSPAYSDLGLNAGTGYRYYVQAFDAVGNTSTASVTVAVTTGDLTAPIFPSGAVLTIQAQSTTQTLVSWPLASDNVSVTGYVVSRTAASDPSTVVNLGTVSGTTGSITDSSLTPGETYTYQVQAIDAAGNVSTALQASVQLPTPDTQAPDTPGDLQTNSVSATSATLTWSKPTDNIGVTGYQVWRSDISGHAIATIANGDTLSFTDSGLTPETAYSYSVIAVDAAGNSSTPATISVTTLADLQAPTAPSNVTAQNVTLTGVTVQWNASTDNIGVTGYEVWRSTTPDGGFSLIASLQPSVTSFADSGLQNGTAYYYFIRAIDAHGNTADSSVLNITTLAPDTTPPTAPTVTATAASFARAHLSWTAATDAGGLGGYTVQRNGATIATVGAGTTSYDDNALAAGQTYSYTITASDVAGNSSQSNTSIVTLPTVSLTSPAAGSTITGTATLTTTTVSGVAGVQFQIDGANMGSEDTAAPFTTSWTSTTVANGTHTVSAIARDSWGNTTTVAPISVTVNNPTSSLALDVNVSADPTTNGSTIVSPTFSTASTNELLVALVETSGPNTSGGQTIKSVTGGNLTWTMRQRANTRYGTAEIWTATASSKLTNVSVTATRNVSGYTGSITILSYTGANLTTIGAVAKASNTTGLPSLTLNATKVGSIVVAAGNDWDGASARTVGPNQTLIHQYLQTSSGDTFWSQKASPSTAIGQTITINDVAPTPSTHQWNLAAVEILPAP